MEEEEKKNPTKCTKKNRETHKEEIKQRTAKKTTCECGSIFRKSDIKRHRKSNKHINLMENVPPNLI